MILTRRFLLILALMFWQGGFMFYGAVVVPVVRSQLEGRPERSTITQHVTQWMNLAGTAAILVSFADVWASPLDRKRWRWIGWLGMALPHPIVVVLHHFMSQQMAVPGFHSSDIASFLTWHRIYLLNNTVQWLSGMVFVVHTIKSWREEDRAGVR